jgi:hypothetical protein
MRNRDEMTAEESLRDSKKKEGKEGEEREGEEGREKETMMAVAAAGVERVP